MQPEPTPQPQHHLTPAPSQPRQRKNSEGIKSVLYTVFLFVLAPLFALFMIMFVFQSYVVDGSSMMPTLQNGNRVFILKLPKTVANVRGQDFIPSRHEIIVFKKPNEPDTQLIKRVIGLPGDRVVVQDSRITIYNADNPGGFNPDDNTAYGPTLEPTTGNVDIIVGDNELFVCGDNRSPGGSLDSRSGLGLVPVQNIVGRLWVRYFPFDEFKIFAQHTTNASRAILTAVSHV